MTATEIKRSAGAGGSYRSKWKNKLCAKSRKRSETIAFFFVCGIIQGGKGIEMIAEKKQQLSDEECVEILKKEPRGN